MLVDWMANLGGVYQRADRSIGRFFAAPFECRACGRPAKPLAKVCRHCGAMYPVRFNIAPSVWITAIGSEAAIVFFRLM